VPLYEINKLLGTHEELSGEYSDSLSGFLLKLFDEIPEKGRAVTYKNIEFVITKIEKNRIKEVKVRAVSDGDD